jgi:transposase
MLTLPPSVKIHLATRPADLRRGFYGLAALTREVLREQPTSGHLFVFGNRRGDLVKILWWSAGGFCLLSKRLEKGKFLFPAAEAESISLEAAELAALLDGLDFRAAKRRKRFVPMVSP